MIAFTQQVAIQNAEYGIRANVILPGLMDTPMAVDTRARAQRQEPRRSRGGARRQGAAAQPHGHRLGRRQCGAVPRLRRGEFHHRRRAAGRRRLARFASAEMCGCSGRDFHGAPSRRRNFRARRFCPQHQIFTGLRAGALVVEFGAGTWAGTGLTAGRVGARARTAAAMLGSALAASLLPSRLAACSTPGVDSSFTVFADPGKYLYYSCEQIAAQKKHWTTREQELRMLMDKAEQGAGGAVVNLIAYKADHVAATEELKMLDKTAREKKCETPANWQQQQRHPLTPVLAAVATPPSSPGPASTARARRGSSSRRGGRRRAARRRRSRACRPRPSAAPPAARGRRRR